MAIAEILQSYLEKDMCSTIVAQNGEAPIQTYLLSIVNRREELNLNESQSNMEDSLNKAKSILQQWIDDEYLSISKDEKTKTITLVPSPVFDIPTLTKHIRTYNILRRRMSKNNLFVRTHSLNTYNNNSFKVRYPIYKIDSVKLVVNPNLVQDSNRLDSLKSKESNPQIELENKLISQYIEQFSNKTIHMDSKYDHRGRLYTMSYPLSFQSDKYTRSIFELKNKELITSKGLNSLLIDIANIIGYDKLTYSERILKAKEFISVEDRAKEFVSNPTMEVNYDNKVRAKSALLAYHNAIHNIPSGYLCSIDATSSGNQIMSILSKSITEAKLTNLTSDNTRYDIYGEVAKEFYRLKNYSPEEIIKLAKQNRKIFKESVMTTGYNSKAVPKNHFAKDTPIFEQAYKNICQGSYELTKIINKAYLDNSHKPILAWELPDGFIAHMKQIRTSYAVVVGKNWSTTIKYYKNDVSIKENERSLCANFIHSVDSYICREVIKRCDFEIMTVHDSFYTHSNNIDTVRQIYNEVLQEINSGEVDILSKFLTDIYGYKVDNPYKDKDCLENIENSLYSLC